MNEALEELVELAESARERAYAPYSGFRVGAALRTSDGAVYTGSNVENASLGLTTCAERVAVFAAVHAGAREVETVVIATEGEEAVAPCGACRQVLLEFGPDLEVVSVAGAARRSWKLSELLPAPFREIPDGRSS